MKTQIKCLFLIGFLLILCFTGCIEEKYKSEQDKFIGNWVAEEEKGYKDRAYQFFKNGTCYINTYNLKGTYHVNETEKILTVNQSSPRVTYVLKYRFNYNYDKLTLINQENFESIIYNRVE